MYMKHLTIAYIHEEGGKIRTQAQDYYSKNFQRLDFSSDVEGGFESPSGRPGRVLFLSEGGVLGE
jgi:hypothetical protein